MAIGVEDPSLQEEKSRDYEQILRQFVQVDYPRIIVSERGSPMAVEMNQNAIQT